MDDRPDPIDRQEKWPIGRLRPNPRNARTHSPEQIAEIAASIHEFGWTTPILVSEDGTIIAGHGRLEAAKRLGLTEVRVAIAPEWWTPEQLRLYVLADNQIALHAGWDEELLKLEIGELQAAGLDVGLAGFGEADLEALFSAADAGAPAAGPRLGSLAERFGIPPFSVLNAREGWWQERKRAWLLLGIESELGRGENLLKFSDTLLEPDPEKRAQRKADAQTFGTGAVKNNAGMSAPDAVFARTAEKRAHAIHSGKVGTGGLTAQVSQAARRGALAERQAGDGRQPNAIPGGSTGPNSAYRARSAQKTVGGLTIGEMRSEYTGGGEGGAVPSSGTSIFDPVLCELAYRWFCPPSGLVLDPFAGGSVRGIVAAKLGRPYVGIDLRPEQLDANRAQAAKIVRDGEPAPVWHEGDSRELRPAMNKKKPAADFVFSCPPYGDLERYSNDPRDLSTMDYEDFLQAYSEVIRGALEQLKPDRFACFVVGDFRDKETGYYRSFVADTIAAFDQFAALYNEAILVTAAGSLPIRVTKMFETSRKLGKTHQNVLVFVKGDPIKATAAIGDVEFGEIETEEAVAEQVIAAPA